MNRKLTAPKIGVYVDWLRNVNYRQFEYAYTYDSQSYADIDELFELLKSFRPQEMDTRKIWTLWLSAERGVLEDFADPNDEDDLELHDAADREELEEVWKDYFPEETSWYEFSALDDPEIQYRTIFLEHRQIIEVDRRKQEKSLEHDISEFTGWLLAEVKDILAEVKDGIYNDRVMRELPPHLKTGTICRKDYFDAFPEYRESFFDGLSGAEINEFIGYVKEQPENYKDMNGYLPFMTANEFFRVCALAYKANHYKDCSRSPIEQYKGNADGRDGGLTKIDPDSSQAFEAWLNDEDRFGAHPWEIYPGGNSTHIDLWPAKGERGYFFGLAGSSEGRCIEAVRIYLALRREGISVYLREANALVDRLLEKEEIGIVPNGVIPRYCESLFPGQHIIDFMNLPWEKEDLDKMLPFIKWQDIEKVELAQK